MLLEGTVGESGATFGLGEKVDHPVRLGRQGDLIVSDLHARYYTQAYYQNLYWARAVVTAPVIFTTAAGTGGPLIWNPVNSKTNVVVLGLSLAVTTVTTVAAGLGITGASGQTSAPTSTTAIDSQQNAYIGGAASTATPFRVGTPTNAGTFFIPFFHLHTGALTTDTSGAHWVDIGGSVVCPPGSWVAVAASATATTTVAQIGMLYVEVPI